MHKPPSITPTAEGDMEDEIVNWIIDLQGGPYDLIHCANLFENGTELRVEREQSGNSIPRYYLHSPEFKELRDTQIHSVAAKMIAKLNEAVKSQGGAGSVMTGLPVTIRADGSRVPMTPVTSSFGMPTENLAAQATEQPVLQDTLLGYGRRIFKIIWPALCAYLVFIVTGVLSSYFLLGFPSVAVTVLLDLITFFIGLYAVTTTIEVVGEIKPIGFRKRLHYIVGDLWKLLCGGS
jgi:hypothetical protein